MQDKLKKAVRAFGVEMVLAQQQPLVTQYMQAFLRDVTSKDIVTLINENKSIPVSDEIINMAKPYADIIADYKLEGLAKQIMEQIYEARPDMAATIMAFDEQGADWIVANAAFLKKRVCGDVEVKQEEVKPESEKPHIVSVHCTNCQGDIFIKSDKVINIKQCPFCGASVNEPEKPKEG